MDEAQSSSEKSAVVDDLKKLIAKLREINSVLAGEFDLAINKLHILSIDQGHSEALVYWKSVSQALIQERNAARADLARIKSITDHPLNLIPDDEELKTHLDGKQPSELPNVT